MTDWLLPLVTHAIAAAIGFLVCRVGTLRAARRWPDHPHLEDVMHADHGAHETAETTVERQVRRGTHIASLAAVAGVLLVIIGGMAWINQNDEARDDARLATAVAELKRTTDCVRTWGEAFAETTTTRTGSNRSTDDAGLLDLERAEQRRDSALDQIILTVIAARKIPPTAGEDDFDRALTEYAAAIRNLERVARDVDTTRALNPYPELDCDDKEE